MRSLDQLLQDVDKIASDLSESYDRTTGFLYVSLTEIHPHLRSPEGVSVLAVLGRPRTAPPDPSDLSPAARESVANQCLHLACVFLGPRLLEAQYRLQSLEQELHEIRVYYEGMPGVGPVPTQG